jgi:hypothetical protein
MQHALTKRLIIVGKMQWGTSFSENFGLLLAGVIPPKFNTHLSSAAGIQTHTRTPQKKRGKGKEKEKSPTTLLEKKLN